MEGNDIWKEGLLARAEKDRIGIPSVAVMAVRQLIINEKSRRFRLFLPLLLS